MFCDLVGDESREPSENVPEPNAERFGAFLGEVERDEENGGHRGENGCNQIKEADVVLHDSRDGKCGTQEAHDDTCNFRIYFAVNRLGRFACGIGGEEVCRHGRKHHDDDSRDAEACKENGLRDIVACADARNFNTDDVHPEACDCVGDCRNGGCLQGLFGVLRVVRNHRQPRNRHGDGNLKNVPELERGCGCGVSGGRCGRTIESEQLHGKNGEQNSESGHHDGCHVGRTAYAHVNPGGNESGENHAS